MEPTGAFLGCPNDWSLHFPYLDASGFIDVYVQREEFGQTGFAC